MPRSERDVRFVRALLAGRKAIADSRGIFRLDGGDGATLDSRKVEALLSSGVLERNGGSVCAGAGARSWLRRRLSEGDVFNEQHRCARTLSDGVRINLAESPLARLAVAGAGESEAFLQPHHVEAGERIRRLVERAQLSPPLTMSYDLARTPSRKAGNTAHDLADTAVEARKTLAEVHRVLPAECAGVLLDVCGLLKGLQLVEQERGWPRRSAKLVLRIALDQVARHFGLAPDARGPARASPRAWMERGARPREFG